MTTATKTTFRVFAMKRNGNRVFFTSERSECATKRMASGYWAAQVYDERGNVIYSKLPQGAPADLYF